MLFINSMELFVRLPGETLLFKQKVEGEKAEVVTGKIVLIARVAEADDKLHKKIIHEGLDFWKQKRDNGRDKGYILIGYAYKNKNQRGF